MSKCFRFLIGVSLFLGVIVFQADPVFSDPQAFHIVIVNEVYSNADGTKQYVELRAKANLETALNVGRVTARNADGTVTSVVFDFTAAFAWSNNETLLLATAAMAGELPTPPDFIIPDGSVPFPSGRIVWEQDPPTTFIVDAVAYGSYTGSNTGYGTPASALPTNGCQALHNVANIAPPGIRNNSTNWGVGLATPQPNDDLPASVSCPAYPVELAPVGSKVTNENQLLQFDASASDINGDAIILTAENLPSGATFNPLTATSKRFSWTPTFLQSDIYNVLFIASSGTDADSENVQITVNEVTDPPVARDSAASTQEDVGVAVILQAFDPDGDPIPRTVTSGPFHGVLQVVNALTGDYTYTPTLNYNGPDSVLFRVNDGFVNSNTAVLQLTTTPVNDAPMANDATSGTAPNTPVAVGQMPATDVDNGSLIFSHVSGPFHGSATNLSTSNGSFDYSPALDYEGEDTVFYAASDGSLADTGRVIITISAGCFCDCHADPICDAVTNIQDVVAVVTIAFRSGTDTVDPACTHAGRSDVNCDCVVSVLDVVNMVNHAFRGDVTPFCDACANPCL